MIYLAQILYFDLLSLPEPARYYAARALEDALEELYSLEIPVNVAVTKYTIDFLVKERSRLVDLLEDLAASSFIEIVTTFSSPLNIEALSPYALESLLAVNRDTVVKAFNVHPQGFYLPNNSWNPLILSALREKDYTYLVLWRDHEITTKVFEVENVLGDSLPAVNLNTGLCYYLLMYLKQNISKEELLKKYKEKARTVDENSILITVIEESKWNHFKKIPELLRTLREAGRFTIFKDYFFKVPPSIKVIMEVPKYAGSNHYLLLYSRAWDKIEETKTLADLVERIGGSRSIIFHVNKLLQEACEVLSKADVYRDSLFIEHIGLALFKVSMAKKQLAFSLA